MAQEFGKQPLRECWQLNSGGSGVVAIASDNVNEILSLDDTGKVQATEKDTGKSLWQSEIGGEILPYIILNKDKLFIASTEYDSKLETELNQRNLPQSFRKTTIYALSRISGITNWQISFQTATDQKKYFFENTNHVFFLTSSGYFFIFNKIQGQLVTEKKLDLKISSLPFSIGSHIFFSDDKNNVLSLDINQGSVRSVFAFNFLPSIIFGIDNKTLFIGNKSGGVVALDVESKKIRWKTQTGAEITNITKVEKGLLVTSFDNYVYLISDKNGKKIWSKRLSGRSLETPLVRDNVAVFSTYEGNDSIFINLKNGKTINRVVISNEDYFLQNPLGIKSLVIFSTSTGLRAYGTDEDCKNK